MSVKYSDKILKLASSYKQQYHNEGKKANWEEIEYLLSKEGLAITSEENLRCAVKAYEKRNGILKTKETQMTTEIENKLNEIEMQIFELKKEKIKLSDERSRLNKVIRDSAREENIQEHMEKCARLVAQEKQLIHIKPIIKKTNKIGILQLSDWHYSLFVSNFLNKYNVEIFKQRIKQLIESAIENGMKNDIEQLFVLLQGDFISSSIHDILRVMNQEDVISQIQVTSEIIAELLNELSNYFPVQVVIVDDNHSRVTADKKKSFDPENYIRLTEWYLKARLNDNNFIAFIESTHDMDISSFKIYNYKCACVHGHRDSFKNIVRTLTSYTREIYDFIFTAHFHHPMIEEQNMTMVIGNGSLVGVDTHSGNLRLSSYPSQNFVLINKDCGLEAIYPVKLK